MNEKEYRRIGEEMDERHEQLHYDWDTYKGRNAPLYWSFLFGLSFIIISLVALLMGAIYSPEQALYVAMMFLFGILFLVIAWVEKSIRQLRYGNLHILARLGTRKAFRTLKDEFGEDYGVE